MIRSNLRRGLLLATAGLVMSAGLTVGGQAFAAHADLKAPVAKPTTTEIDGRVWKCEGDACEGSGDGASQSLKRECKHVAAELGALKAYKSENGSLDGAAVEVCNTK